MRRMTHLLPIAALMFVPPAPAADSNYRCGKWVISSSMSVGELIDKCGEPTSRTSETRDVRGRNSNTGLMQKTGETVIETLTFDRGSTAPPLVVTVVDGRIKSIERAK